MIIFLAFCHLLFFQAPFRGQNTTTAAGGTFNCGKSTLGATTQSGIANIALFTPCTTGSNPGGYSLAHFNIGVSTSAGTLYGAIYADTTVSCTTGTHCPSTQVCVDSIGVPAGSSGSFTEDTLLSGCGILPPNTSFWAAANQSSGSFATAYDAGNCSFGQPTSFNTTGFSAGTWGAAANVGNGQGGGCYPIYMVLNIL